MGQEGGFRGGEAVLLLHRTVVSRQSDLDNSLTHRTDRGKPSMTILTLNLSIMNNIHPANAATHQTELSMA